METAHLLYYQACEAGEGIIGHRVIQIFCLSVGCMSVCLSVCLSVCCRRFVCLSMINKLLPAYRTDHNLNAYTGSFQTIARFSQDLILIAVQSPAPQRPRKNDPQNENFYFLTYWLEILYISSWPLSHHKSWIKSQLQGAQLCMLRSISFSFVCIDLKFCR